MEVTKTLGRHSSALGRERRSRIRAWVTLTLAAVAATIAPCAPSTALATTLEPMPIERAAQIASTIAVGTVAGTRTESSAAGVRTTVQIHAEETLKGPHADTLTVYVPGGSLPDGGREIVEGMASFAPGEACIVFADKNGWVLGGYQGKVRLGASALDQDAATRSAVTARVRAAIAGADAAPDPAPASPSADSDTAASQTAISPPVSLAVAGPHVSSVSPSSASAGTGTHVTISGSGFGAAPGKVEFSLNVFGIARIGAEDIESWSDTQIECEVPAYKIAGSILSAGNGPVIVTTQSGSQSNPYEVVVPFGYAGAKWQTPSVTYLVNPGGVDVVKREKYVDGGAVPWNGARSAFSFVDGGATSSVAQKDGKNVVCWSSTIPSGIVALTSVYTDGSGGITECDLQFNSAVNWGDGVVAGTRDVQTIALHEMGHWLCLLDQYNSGDAEKVMYGFEVVGQRRQLTQGEISGIRWIYPAPSGSLHGTVRDAHGDPLAGAHITVDTCEPVLSRSDGTFDVSGVPAGDYQFAASLAGYTTSVQPVTIVAEQTTNSDVTLGPGARIPVYRFYQRQNGSHFYTSSAAERDTVIARLDAFYAFEGVAYAYNRLDPANSSPLFRFYNRRNGSHFYTVSLAERDRVIAQLTDTYAYEGVAYHVSAAPARASSQVFRFYNRRNGSHFYTTSTAEKYAVIHNLSATYTYEGPAFWVAP